MCCLVFPFGNGHGGSSIGKSYKVPHLPLSFHLSLGIECTCTPFSNYPLRGSVLHVGQYPTFHLQGPGLFKNVLNPDQSQAWKPRSNHFRGPGSFGLKLYSPRKSNLSFPNLFLMATTLPLARASIQPNGSGPNRRFRLFSSGRVTVSKTCPSWQEAIKRTKLAIRNESFMLHGKRFSSLPESNGYRS